MDSTENSSRSRHNNSAEEKTTSDMTFAENKDTSVNSTGKNSKEPAMDKSKGEINLFGRTGGAYIPPARLRMMQKDITDKNSAEYQRISWEALKKSINGLINKVNVANIAIIVREMFKENLIRGRGLLCRSVISAQTASPTFTHVYATLVAITNTKVSLVLNQNKFCFYCSQF